jgi:excisionase family DNA binding protein
LTQGKKVERDDRWMGLGEASALLGVHPSTLRRWSDDGQVPFRRTAGGHRRFDRRELELRLRGSSAQAESSQSSKDEAEPAWRRQLGDGANVAQLRQMGQRLSGIVVQFLGRDDEDPRLLTEATSLGRAYAVTSRDAGMSLAEAVEAFLFYRANLIRLLPRDPGSDASLVAIHYERYDRLVSAVLIGLVRGYDAN